MNVSKAIIVAAGDGKRLRPLTDHLPKCLLEVNGTSLIGRSTAILKQCGISQIVVVVGFLWEKVMDHLGPNVTYVHNPFFRSTNNMASLWFARNAVGEDAFLYLHADLYYHVGMIEECLGAPGEIAMLTDPGSCDAETMKVRAEGDRFVESSKSIPPDQVYGEWTGIARLGSTGAKATFAEIDELLGQGRFMDYDTAAFSRLASRGMDIRICSTNGLPWVEIDVEADLQYARSLAQTAGDGQWHKEGQAWS